MTSCKACDGKKNSNGCKTLIYCCNEWTLNFLCRKTEDCSLQFEQKVILIYVIQISLGFSTRLNKHVCCRLSSSRLKPALCTASHIRQSCYTLPMYHRWFFIDEQRLPHEKTPMLLLTYQLNWTWARVLW